MEVNMTEQVPNAHLLVVCRANVCRSPLAEFVAAGRLAGTGIAVSSAGTDAAIGQGLCDEVEAYIAGTAGGTSFAGAHRVTPISAPRVTAADLILTMSTRERSRVAMTHPALRERTFTLVEADRLLTRLPVEGGRFGTLEELARRLHELRWMASEENWPSRSRFRELVDRRRPVQGLSVRDAHMSKHRPSHRRVLQSTETLMGHVSDEVLVRLGVRSRTEDERPEADAEAGGDSRHAS